MILSSPEPFLTQEALRRACDHDPCLDTGQSRPSQNYARAKVVSSFTSVSGLTPIRYGQRGQSLDSQFLICLYAPAIQSKHFALMAFSGLSLRIIKSSLISVMPALASTIRDSLSNKKN